MRNFIFLTSLFLASFTQAQVSISNTSLQFGDVFSGEASSKTVDLKNEFDVDVVCQISSTNRDFSSSDTVITLKKGETKQLSITFQPRHNVTYNEELLIKTDSRSGAFSVDLDGQGNYKDAYYNNTKNLWDEDLKSALKTTISANYVNFGYNGARDKMYGDIDNVGGKVTCVYTGRVATFNDRDGANSNNINCEHTWPQSLFNSNEPERADIHHLFPTDVSANSQRGNYPFGVVSSPTWNVGGSKQAGSLFEPRDPHKGDVARAMFYFSTRYTNYSGFLTSQESVLRTWAKAYPPTEWSKTRNEKIYGYQKNRNPFVDHPEFLDRITSLSTTSTRPKVVSYLTSANSVNLGEFPKTKGIVYHFVIVNNGNQPLLFNNIENNRAEFVIPKEDFNLAPGDAKSLWIEVKSNNQLGALLDTLSMNVVGQSKKIQIPLTVNILSLSSIESFHQKAFIETRLNTLIVHNAAGFSCSIYRMNGQLDTLNEITSDFTEMEMTHLVPGVYFASLTNESGVNIIKKFTITP